MAVNNSSFHGRRDFFELLAPMTYYLAMIREVLSDVDLYFKAKNQFFLSPKLSNFFLKNPPFRNFTDHPHSNSEKRTNFKLTTILKKKIRFLKNYNRYYFLRAF